MVFVHRWFGLLAGVWLFVLALTGTFLVFYEEVDHALNRDVFHRPVVGERLPYEDLVRAAEASWPGSYARFVDLPNEAHEPLIAYLGALPDSGQKLPRRLNVLVDPYTAEVLVSRAPSASKMDRRHIARWIYQLHMNLHFGSFGTVLLGIVALFWVFDHLPSVWLSFPNLRQWYRSFLVKRNAKGLPQAYGLHRASGLWLLPVTLILAISGVYFNLRPVFNGAVEIFSPISPSVFRTLPRVDEPIYQGEITIDEALATATRVADGAEVDSLSFLPNNGLYWARVFDPRDLADYGQRYIYVSMVDGTVVGDHHRAEGTAADTFVALQFPLHSGKIFGWAGRLIIALTGLVLCALVITGFTLWFRKRKGRRKARRSSREQTDGKTKPAMPLPKAARSRIDVRDGQPANQSSP